jgi:uncharacterized Zn finger protein
MNLAKATETDLCPRCGVGKMARVSVMPIRRRPGLSEVQYRCTECGEVVKQTEDDRFRD